MPASSSVFPAFITDEYRPGGGFPRFEEEARASSERVRRQFQTDFSEIQNIASRALSAPRNQAGSLDLGVGQYRQAAEGANAQAIALRELATAAERAARASGDTTEATRLYVQASRAAAIEAENNARSANDQVVALERVQAELNLTASRTQMVIGANRNLQNSQGQLGTSARAARFGYIQLNQQLQDVAIQAQAGVNPLTILVQQGTQASFALSQMGGIAGRVGTFFAGGWGTALFIGIAAIGALTGAMRSNTAAAEQAKTGASGLSDAQSVLGEMFDLTSGKLQHQNELLRLNARLTALNLQATAMTEQEQARQTYQNLGSRGVGARLALAGHGVAQDWTPQAIADAQSQADAYSARVQALLTQVGAGRVSAEHALQLSRSINFDYLNVTREEFQQAIIHRDSSRAREDIARRINQSLDTNTLDPALRRDAHGRQPREDHRPQQADASLEQIQRINEAWNEQPALVDRAVQAVRQLDHILAEAQRLKLPHFGEMAAGAHEAEQAIREGLIRQIAQGFDEAPKLIQRATTAMEQLNAAAAHFPEMAPQIAAAGQAVENALLRPYRDVLENLVQQADQQELIRQGREGEAQALTLIRQLEDQLGDIGEQRRQTIIAGVSALQEYARQTQIIQDRQQSYLRAVGSVRTSVEGLFANPGNPGDFFSGITRAFNQLNAEALTERLFGGVFRKMEDQATGRDRVRNENINYATAIANMRTTLAGLNDAEGTHRQSLDEVIAATHRFTDALGSATARLTGSPLPAAAPGSDLANWQNAGSGPAGLATSVTGTVTTAIERALQPFSSISSGFGPRRPPIAGASSNHPGDDFPAPYGTPIVAPFSGRVSAAGAHGGYGNAVVIDMGNGFQSLDGHMSSIAVSVGQLVHQGEVIGRVGATGVATGNHLHEEFRRNGVAVNPATIYGHDFTVQVGQASQAVQGLGTGLHDLDVTVAHLVDSVSPATQALSAVEGTINSVFDSIGQQIADAANDNDAIIVHGPHRGQGGRAGSIVDATTNLDPRQFARTMAIEMSKRVFGQDFGTQAGGAIANALQGALFGNQLGGILRAGGINIPSGLAQGLGALAGQIPGFGNAFAGISSAMPLIGAAVSVNHAIGNLLGNSQIKHGDLLNLIIGPFLTALLGSAKRGSATISSVDGTPTTRGNDSSRIATATTLATGVQAAIQHIADALGGEIGSFSGSIGVRKKKYVVDPTGQGRTKGSGTMSFDDQADAVAALLRDAIMDGAIQGLRAGEQALLAKAKDIDTGIAKAIKFEAVFTDLKARLDPVGAALDVLDKKFSDLKNIFAEAGASAEDYAKLEQEYGLERADAVKQAGEAMTSALRSLLDDLTTNNPALSLRDRLASAHATYDPLAARVAAGDQSVSYDDFASAARALLDIQRQISGSDQPYFDLLTQVTELTKTTLDHQQSLIDAAQQQSTPFTDTVTAGDTQTVTAIDRLGGLLVGQLGGQLSAINDNIASLVRQGASDTGGGGGGSFPAFGPLHNF